MNARFGGRFLRVLVAALLTAYVLWQSDPRAVGAAVARADLGPIAIAVLLVLLDRTLMAWRWVALLCIVDPADRPRFGRLLEIFLVSTFLGTFLPASVGGDAVRAYGLSRDRVRGADAVATVFMDRMLGVASLLVVGALGLGLAGDLASDRAVVAGLVAAAIACVPVVAIIFSARAAGAASAMVRLAPIAALQRAGEAVVRSVQQYSKHHGTLLAVLAASIGVQVLRIVQAYFLGRALGIDAGLAVYFAFVPLILLVMLLPVTVNGLGTSQAAFVWFFARAGVASAPAFALSVLFVALGIVGNLPGAVIYATRGFSTAAAPGAAKQRSELRL